MNKFRLILDRVFSRVMRGLAFLSLCILFCMFISLLYRSLPLLREHSLQSLLFSSSWHPMNGEFGFLPFILSTLIITCIALVIAVPLSLLAAIYITEYAPPFIVRPVSSLIDVLSGIPSVIYGLWGIIIVVPFINQFIGPLFHSKTTGYSLLAGGIVLSFMIIPGILHVHMEVLNTIEKDLRDAALSLGATRWQTIKYVVLRKALPGIIAGIVLGLSRAFGETMAVMMVCGNVPRITTSILDPGYPLPALIANNYGEMLSIPLYDSALLFAAFLLFVIILFFNIVSRIVLINVERRIR
jgi:phosphate transport system permease protein